MLEYRVFFFFLFFGLFSSLGYLYQTRKYQKEDLNRFKHNVFLHIFNAIFIGAIFGKQVTQFAAQNQLGLFNIVEVPYFFQFTLLIIIQDMIIYWQHRISHLWTPLWRLHRVHHTDIQYDSSTALRFHPLEILFSLCVKALFILILGIDSISFLAFEIILNGSALFNHANFRLPQKLEFISRRLIVTPSFHRIHHTGFSDEINSNFGFFLSIWDYIFNSYRPKARGDEAEMSLGLKQFRKTQDQNVLNLLRQPFQ